MRSANNHIVNYVLLKTVHKPLASNFTYLVNTGNSECLIVCSQIKHIDVVLQMYKLFNFVPTSNPIVFNNSLLIWCGNLIKNVKNWLLNLNANSLLSGLGLVKGGLLNKGIRPIFFVQNLTFYLT